MTIKQMLKILNNYGLDIDCVHFERNHKNHGYILYGNVVIDDEITTTDFFLGSKYQAKKVLKRLLKSFI